MTDEAKKAEEEAYLNEHMGGGWLGPSSEMVHDFVEHQNDMQVVNDIHPAQDTDGPSAATIGTAAIEALDVGHGLLEADPMAIAQAGAAALELTMGPHAADVEQRLGEYGGTSPDGGLPDAAGSGSE